VLRTALTTLAFQRRSRSLRPVDPGATKTNLPATHPKAYASHTPVPRAQLRRSQSCARRKSGFDARSPPPAAAWPTRRAQTTRPGGRSP
jgi:hypothetical protein